MAITVDQELTAKASLELTAKALASVESVALVPSHREAELDQPLVDQWLVASVAQWAAE